jgi:hypothetical protein
MALMMIAMFWLGLVTTSPQIIFVGNSHTAYGDVPGQVGEMVARVPGFEKAMTSSYGVAFLNDWKQNQSLVERVKLGRITHAVLQGAKVSSSHRYVYSQVEGVELAKLLGKQGVKVYFVSEWPRRDWNETDYIEAVYREMAKESGATIIPVGRVWDAYRSIDAKTELWGSDGNHAAMVGSYLSARTIAAVLSGNLVGRFRPAGVLADHERSVDLALQRVLEPVEK